MTAFQIKNWVFENRKKWKSIKTMNICGYHFINFLNQEKETDKISKFVCEINTKH